MKGRMTTGMTTGMTSGTSSGMTTGATTTGARGERLRRLLRRPPLPLAAGTDHPERCELCAQPAPPGHRHLVDREQRVLRCACRACALLFDRPGAGSGRYLLVPEHRVHLPGFVLDEATWRAMGIPVGLAFFFHDSAAGRTVAFYPSPAGAVEASLAPAAWAGVVADNPVLRALAPDVEALLVDRTRPPGDQLLVPIDDCYALVALIRTRWRGLAGGPAVREAVGGFFDDLRARAGTRGPAPAASGRPATAAGSAGTGRETADG